MHSVVEQAYPFQQSTKDRLTDAITRLIKLYAKCVTQDDVSAATRQLKVHQREHIAWERDTVWRQMIAQERRGEADGKVKALGGHVEEEETWTLSLGKFRLKRRYISLAVAIVVFITLLNIQTMPGEEASKCFAILTFSTLLWATEVSLVGL